ncbi:MAG: DUF222 domain-containing protein [Microbacteriaceae bacterium]|nr:DUF222 domain-containing protein [Microbacteriaceae bacterium]
MTRTTAFLPENALAELPGAHVDAAAGRAGTDDPALEGGASLDYSRALDRAAATRREIDALEARHAREVAAVLAAAGRVEIVAGTTSPSRRFEFVQRSVRADLALAERVSERVAGRTADLATTLTTHLERTLDAVESGMIPWRAAVLVAAAAEPLLADLRAGGPDRIGEFEAAALTVAVRVAPARLRGRLSALVDRLRTVPPECRHRTAAEERHLHVEDVADGMSWLHAYLPSVEAHAITHRLTDMARRARDLDAEEGITDARTLEQRRTDLLVDFLTGDHIRTGDHEHRVALGRDFGRFAGIRPTVVVTVPVQDLLDLPTTAAGLDLAAEPPGSRGIEAGSASGLGSGSGSGPDPAPAPVPGPGPGLPPARIPAMLDGTVPIDPATARALAANAPTLHRMLVDPHTGVALDLSRTRYQPSADLRLWLRLRDETCRFPGCAREAKGCDVDHTIDWQYGGPTSAANLAHLCRSHHTLKHQTRWAMTQHADGSITWRSPSGRTHTTGAPGQAEGVG